MVRLIFPLDIRHPVVCAVAGRIQQLHLLPSFSAGPATRRIGFADDGDRYRTIVQASHWDNIGGGHTELQGQGKGELRIAQIEAARRGVTALRPMRTVACQLLWPLITLWARNQSPG